MEKSCCRRPDRDRRVSFFKAIWERISNSLHGAITGMLYFYSSFSMDVRAYCEEFENDRFGLEVICFGSDKESPHSHTYKFLVGKSQSKMVKPGKLHVTLKSLYFIADVEAGEDETLVKEEDFRGLDFDKQFACRFKDGVKIERGPFGKVIVTRNKEPLFEFNIQKSGRENEKTAVEQDRWAQLAISELAGSLFITVDDNWKKLATHIGFNKIEIKNNFKSAGDPITAIIEKYRERGGTADEFVNALYSVHRDLKICLSSPSTPSSPSNSIQSRSSNNSSGRGSLAKFNKKRYGNGHESDTSGTQASQYSQDSLLSSVRKRSSTNVVETPRDPKPKKSKYNDNDDADGETSSNSEGEMTKSKKSSDSNSIKHRNDMTKLHHNFLWEISAFMDTPSWRAMGRSLGVEEPVLINIDHVYKTQGFREMSYQVLLNWKEKYPRRCTFGTLYKALCKEKLNAAANNMSNIENNHE